MTATLRPMTLGEIIDRMFRFCAVLSLGIWLAGTWMRAQGPPPPSAQTTVRVQDRSMEAYQQHLIALESLVEACVAARDAKTCDPALVGSDDRVSITIGSKTEPRVIRYGWLRGLFLKAETKDDSAEKTEDGKDAPKPAGDHAPSRSPTTHLLKDAEARLEQDLTQSRAPLVAPPDHAKERAVMLEVLAGPEFRHLQEQTAKDSFLEKFARWLNHLFASAAMLKARSAWIGRVIVWGFILGVCVALMFALLRLERRWRVRLTPDDNERPAPGAASARDWQLWLEDARRARERGEWREAIHFLYWAAISRLESRRLWPADRARTPREYLALVAQEDPRRTGLSQLTHTFERFWYGGRAAGESDYKAAESLTTSLIGGGASSVTASNSASSEGGAR